jgi:hypothetical protein
MTTATWTILVISILMIAFLALFWGQGDRRS